MQLLRIKRLASLGFPLSRIGEVLAELDATPPEDASAGSLDELDRELTLQIEQLQEKRRTIAQLKAENLSPDLPVRFSRVLRNISCEKRLITGFDDADRAVVLLAGNLYTDRDVSELEDITQALDNQGLIDAIRQLDERCMALAPDAPESERAQLVQDSVNAMQPLFAHLSRENWLRPPTEGELLLEQVSSDSLNPAQRDVTERITRYIEDYMASSQSV